MRYRRNAKRRFDWLLVIEFRKRYGRISMRYDVVENPAVDRGSFDFNIKGVAARKLRASLSYRVAMRLRMALAASPSVPLR
jgi:hypothetical protein